MRAPSEFVGAELRSFEQRQLAEGGNTVVLRCGACVEVGRAGRVWGGEGQRWLQWHSTAAVAASHCKVLSITSSRATAVDPCRQLPYC